MSLVLTGIDGRSTRSKPAATASRPTADRSCVQWKIGRRQIPAPTRRFADSEIPCLLASGPQWMACSITSAVHHVHRLARPIAQQETRWSHVHADVAGGSAAQASTKVMFTGKSPCCAFRISSFLHRSGPVDSTGLGTNGSGVAQMT